MHQIAQGAEAVLFEDRGTIIKERLSKNYRLPQLDEALRQFRTRREAKILQRLEKIDNRRLSKSVLSLSACTHS